MLLRSQIAENLLARGAKLIIVSRATDEPYFRQEFSHPQISLEEMPQRFSRVESTLINLRQYFLMNASLGATLNYKNEAFRRERPRRYWIARAVNSVLGRIPPLRRAYLAGEARVFPGAEFDELLKRYRPDLVVTGTPGLNRNDVHLMRAARRARHRDGHGHALVGQSLQQRVHGRPARPFARVERLDGQGSCAVSQLSARPHSMVRGRAVRPLSSTFASISTATAWRQKEGVPDGRPLIVYGTINPWIMPHEFQTVRQIVDAIDGSAFKMKPYLWIRMHPQAVRGEFSCSVQPYRELAGPDVRIEEPPVQSEKLAWDLPKKDTEHLAQLMTAADVVVTPCSTLSIDAACVDTPIINVFFDGETPVHPGVSARRFMHYTHYAHILDTGGIAKAMNIEDFVRMTDAYFENPRLDSAGRQNILRQQFNQIDGQAARGRQNCSGRSPYAAARIIARSLSSTDALTEFHRMGIAPSQKAAMSETRTAGGPKILFNITHGFQARMLLRFRDLGNTARSRRNTGDCFGRQRESYFHREFSHPQIVLEDMPHRLSRIESHLINLRQYLLMNPSLGTTLNFKNEAMRRRGRSDIG